MKKYFISQWKRGLRLFPGMVCVVGILFSCLGIAFFSLSRYAQSETQTRFKIGVVGSVGDNYLELGLAALQMMDSSRYSLELIPMEKGAAEEALTQGAVTAYVVVPEGFMDAAFSGHFIPLTFYSSPGSSDFSSILDEEITAIVERMLLATQKGYYGLFNALKALGSNTSNHISADYVRHLLTRSKIYRAEELGISQGLTLDRYLLCGLSVVLTLLCCLSFAPFLIKKDMSLLRILSTGYCSPAKQLLCEFFLFFLFLLTPIAGAFLLLSLFNVVTLAPAALLYALPAFFALSALSFFLFQFARDYISGILFQFFITVALCFLSGCLYPPFFFPPSIQQLATHLPTGLALQQFSACLTGSFPLLPCCLLLLYGCTFLTLSFPVRRIQLRGGSL